MKKVLPFLLLLPVVGTAFGAGESVTPPVTSPIRIKQSSSNSDLKGRARATQLLRRLPLRFEENRGQADPRVRFLSRGDGYTLFLTPQETVLTLNRPVEPAKQRAEEALKHPGSSRTVSGREDRRAAVIRMKLVGANPSPTIRGAGGVVTEGSYFLGGDSSRWRKHVPAYRKVRYTGVYPGIDLVHYGNQRELEHDFIVAPGADPSRILWKISGADRVRIDGRGNLALHTPEGVVLQRKPVLYQVIGGARKPVRGGYVLKEKNQIAFNVGRYDRSKPLVIDPVLAYSSFLGGDGNDYGSDVAVDAKGNVYVTGYTNSANFPVAGKEVSGFKGSDVFVAKLPPGGKTLAFSAYLGGSDYDTSWSLALDPAGNVVVSGYTSSTDFPTVKPIASHTDTKYYTGFVFKMAPDGSSLVYSTYLPSGINAIEGNLFGGGLAVDRDGNALVTGWYGTDSLSFPVADVFVDKISADGQSFLYQKSLGGNSLDFDGDIAVGADGNAWVTGQTSSSGFPTTPDAYDPKGKSGYDAFVTKLSPAGDVLYSTYFGGDGNDEGHGIAVDAQGGVYVAGTTPSTDFPLKGAIQGTYGGRGSSGYGDAFAAKFNLDGTLAYSTYLGGTGDDRGVGVAVDGSGRAYVIGITGSADFPVKGTVQAAFGGGECGSASFPSPCTDAFVAELAPDGGSLVYSTTLGGDKRDDSSGLTVDTLGNVYVIGSAYSSGFRTVDGYQTTFGGGDADAYLVRIRNDDGTDPPLTPQVTPGDVNGDAAIDVQDAVGVLRSIVGIEPLNDAGKAAADFNGDGTVDVQDVVAILKKAVGL